MKKLLLSVILSALLLSVTACGGEAQTDSTASDSISWYIPCEPDLWDPSDDNFVVENVATETDYSNIVAYAEQSKYPVDEAVIEYHIRNNNKNTGFWHYVYPYVQYCRGEEWITLPLKGNGSQDAMSWVFEIGMDENGYVVADGKCDLDKKLAVEVIPGKYRIVGYVADRALYVEFEIV